MQTYNGPIFDADTHIQEEDFAFFEQYLPKKYHEDWLLQKKYGPDGQYAMYVGKRRVENTEANPQGWVPPPGRLKEWLRAMKSGEDVLTGWAPPTPDMINRDARVKKLDEFGVESCILFVGGFVGTIGYYDQPEPAHAAFHAYNEYVNDQWGFDYKSRLYSTGLLTLADLDLAVKEVDWLLKRGVRIVVMPMGPVNGKSPADPYFDPVWSRLNDAGVVVSYHVSEANFMHPIIRAFGEKPLQSRRMGQTAWQWMFTYSEIPVEMTLANIVLNNFFQRYPKIKMASVENGAEWLPRFLSKMDKMRGMAKNGYWPGGQLTERPSEIFKRHVRVVAYPEDNVKKIVEEIGDARCIMMGSDYPHAEGVPTPMDFFSEALTQLPDPIVQQIMYDNGRTLIPV